MWSHLLKARVLFSGWLASVRLDQADGYLRRPLAPVIYDSRVQSVIYVTNSSCIVRLRHQWVTFYLHLPVATKRGKSDTILKHIGLALTKSESSAHNAPCLFFFVPRSLCQPALLARLLLPALFCYVFSCSAVVCFVHTRHSCHRLYVHTVAHRRRIVLVRIAMRTAS